MKSNKIERIAYNMGDKSKKNILIFLAISKEQLKDIVCMLVVNRFIIYLLYTTSLFLFCLFGRRPRGSDVHVHVYYCKGHSIK